MSTPVTVDIWSDISCPYCYIGMKKFQVAVEQSGIPVVVQYRSFELDPRAPQNVSGSHADQMALKMGWSPEEARAVESDITSAAAQVGLDFRYDLVQPVNTRSAHQVLHYAKTQGLQSELKERLLQAYFTQGGNVGRDSELVALATEVGLDPAGVTRVLQTGEFQSAIELDREQALDQGVRSVPFFVLNNEYALAGAQETEQFIQALKQASLSAETN